MSPTRRNVLHTLNAGAAYFLMGCVEVEDHQNKPTQAVIANTSTETIQRTSKNSVADPQTTTNMPGTVETPPLPGRDAIEFVHKKQFIDSGLAGRDSEAAYFARHVRTERELEALALGNVADDFDWQTLTRAREFLDGVSFDDSSLVVVQSPVSDTRNGLRLQLYADRGTHPNRDAPPLHLVTTVRRTRTRVTNAGAAVSTLLVACPPASALRRPPCITLKRHFGETTPTFRPPAALQYESLETMGSKVPAATSIPMPGARLITDSEAAETLADGAANRPAAFLTDTDYDTDSLLVVKADMAAYGKRLVVRSLRRDDQFRPTVWKYVFGGGPQAEYTSLLFTRVPAATATAGTLALENVRAPPESRDIEVQSRTEVEIRRDAQ